MGEQTRETLAEKVRHLRAERSWPQEQLADASGLSLRTVQRVENGMPCSPDTVQALAAAFNVNAMSLAKLHPDNQHHGRKWFGLSAGAAPWVGFILSGPALLFILTNIGFYNLGWAWIEPLLLQRLMGGVLANPLLLLGGPVLAAILNAPHLFAVRARSTRQGELIEGVLISWNPARFAIVALALGLFLFLLAYAIGENMMHIIQEIAAPEG
ncbi:MAG: hypothetical protein DHS20C05_08780 [Hyphococcus sp.]|nr:MAG: hypothetical protein DHS20C05_08780 [Marinicaulis sp.]